MAITVPVQGAFTSFYVFGDGISTTTDNTAGMTNYYGKRYTNGRVWAEVLAQRQGLGANSITNTVWSNTNDFSYYGQFSSNLVINLKTFCAPRDVGTALFVVWVNDADFVNDMTGIFPSTNLVAWNNAINQSLNSHYLVITNLYAKGVRTLIMPNAVDITEVPEYNGLVVSMPATRNFIRQQVINFNTQFNATLNTARANCPGLTIYTPDFFSLLDGMLTNAAAYGLTNALSNGSITCSTWAWQNAAMNCQGTNYIFWDEMDPTAQAHEIMADIVQQMISPVQVGQASALDGTNQFYVLNLPVGLNGCVDGCTNIGAPAWSVVQNVSGTSPTQLISIPPASQPQVSPDDEGPPAPPGASEGSTNAMVVTQQYYRVHFPFAWCWP